ncbi:MAG: hypothetical protein ACEQSA_03655 [Weeksellaceae bacterium]
MEVQKETVVTTSATSASSTAQTPRTYQKKKAIFRTYQVIWYILGVIEILLAFRILLKMMGANPASGFAAVVYALSDPFALPFYGVLGVTYAGNNIFEWTTFIAMAVYWVIAYGIIYMLQIMRPTTPAEVEANVQNP